MLSKWQSVHGIYFHLSVLNPFTETKKTIPPSMLKDIKYKRYKLGISVEPSRQDVVLGVGHYTLTPNKSEPLGKMEWSTLNPTFFSEIALLEYDENLIIM